MSAKDNGSSIYCSLLNNENRIYMTSNMLLLIMEKDLRDRQPCLTITMNSKKAAHSVGDNLKFTCRAYNLPAYTYLEWFHDREKGEALWIAGNTSLSLTIDWIVHENHNGSKLRCQSVVRGFTALNISTKLRVINYEPATTTPVNTISRRKLSGHVIYVTTLRPITSTTPKPREEPSQGSLENSTYGPSAETITLSIIAVLLIVVTLVVSFYYYTKRNKHEREVYTCRQVLYAVLDIPQSNCSDKELNKEVQYAEIIGVIMPKNK